MTTKLTLLVTCTNRKTTATSSELQVRNLPDAPLEERVRHWNQRLASAGTRRPLRELYKGEAWAQVRQLEKTARASGYEPTVVVASAGLGLRGIDYPSPAYAATFNRPHKDAVGDTNSAASSWWKHLHDQDSERPALKGPMLWVLSQSYSAAISQHLLAYADTAELLVFGGSDHIAPAQRMPSDRSLRSSLGGTANGLNLRMAIRWLELAEDGGLFTAATRERWNAWAAVSRRTEVHGRMTLSDSAVLDFIGSLRSSDPGIPKTRALRLLRDAGYACEQRRFNTLFEPTGARS
ncbi:hypothetical protein [Nocardioides yefusunii]|uniref:Uncharacterized protein n=1 Tax=Nocardioides yefusunii TaxID=2500546 RepID=A0ABW1R0H6_9ACTN|nr:hypothetical protein [Nocardioides yefusunii]